MRPSLPSDVISAAEAVLDRLDIDYITLDGHTIAMASKQRMTHWQKLHEAANEARERVSKAYMQMDEIDRNADLSRDGKYRQRHKTAAQAIADFEASKTLARAREAVELAVAKHDVEQHISPEIAEARNATLKAMKEAEQGWQKAMDKIAERASLTKGPDTRR